MGGTRAAAPFFAAPRHARVLGCAVGLLVGVSGPPAVVGDLGSCPWPVVILPYGLRGRGFPPWRAPLRLPLHPRRLEGRHAFREIVEPGDELRVVVAPLALEAQVEIAERAGERDMADVDRRRRGSVERAFRLVERA